jgi:hypothetical protein
MLRRRRNARPRLTCTMSKTSVTRVSAYRVPGATGTQIRITTFNLETFDETGPGMRPSLAQRVALIKPQIRTSPTSPGSTRS